MNVSFWDRFYSSMYAVFRDLEQQVQSAVISRRMTSESAARIEVLNNEFLDSLKKQHRIHDEMLKIQNTMQYLAAYGFEASEVLAGLQDKTADMATKIGPGGKNLHWSPTYLRGVMLSALDSQPAVMAEAINNLSADEWQRLTELRR